MARLTTKARKKLPKQDFALPSKKAYPIPDRAHAKAALARAAANATPAEQATIRRKVEKKFPGMTLAKGKGK